MANPWCDQTYIGTSIPNLITISRATYRQRNELLDHLMNLDPLGNRNYAFGEVFYQLLKVDDACFCRGVVSRNTYLTPAIYLGRILGQGKVGAAYDLFDRSNHDANLIIKVIGDIEYKNYLSIQVEIYSPGELDERIQRYLNNHPFADTRGNPITFAFRSDDFANQTILHMLLDAILSVYGNNNYVRQIDAFICNGLALYEGIPNGYHGYNITEKAALGDLTEFIESQIGVTRDLIDDILIQILSTLQILQQDEYSFIHSDLKARNIFVDNSTGLIIYKIADYDKCSITWKGVRFYNRKSVVETAAKLTSSIKGWFYTPQTTDITESLQSVTIKKFDTVYYYRISNNTYISIATRHTTIPFYFTYDIASFLWSLLMESPVYLWYRNTNTTRLHVAIQFIFGNDQAQTFNRVVESIHREYNSLKGEAQRSKLIAMRSISEMNTIFYQNNIFIRRDLDDFYDQIGIPRVQPRDVQRLPVGFYASPILLSEGRKPCITPCQKYKRQGGTYISEDSRYQIRSNDLGSLTMYPSEIIACQTYPYTVNNCEYVWSYCTP